MYKGKKVLLTGPAPHILEQRIKADQYDYVVRVNQMIPMSEALISATGERCDVWYPANQLLEQRPELCALPEVKIIRTTRLGASHIPQHCMHKWSHATWDLNRIMAEIGCMPNRGLRAIIDILAHDPQLLYITGFSFYQVGAYYQGYTTQAINKEHIRTKGNMGGHTQAGQIAYFRKHIYKDPRVKVDPVLEMVMYSAGEGQLDGRR